MTALEPTETLRKSISLVLEALNDKQAAYISIIDVSEVSSLTDYLIIATGTSNPHLKALRGVVDKALKDNGINTIGADISQESGWLVVDAFDFMVHLFTPEMREQYRLDTLWKDGILTSPEEW